LSAKIIIEIRVLAKFSSFVFAALGCALGKNKSAKCAVAIKLFLKNVRWQKKLNHEALPVH
jgi:hypothetical protein